MIETTAQRTDRMLHQSYLKNTEVQACTYLPGWYFMRSDSTPANVWYLVNAAVCGCQWAAHNATVCSHRARAAFEDEFRGGPAATGPAADTMLAERTLPPAA